MSRFWIEYQQVSRERIAAAAAARATKTRRCACGAPTMSPKAKRCMDCFIDVSMGASRSERKRAWLHKKKATRATIEDTR